MEILKRLTNEHGNILKAIELLCRARDALEKNQYLPFSFFESAIFFFRTYADKAHHYKEEYLLFSLLARKKGGHLDLAMGALRHQHELNRACLVKIETALKGYEMKNEIAVTTLLMNVAGFISILKRHINREDQVFFPMAKAELSEDEKMMLQQQFDQEEAGKTQMVQTSFQHLEKMAAAFGDQG